LGEFGITEQITKFVHLANPPSPSRYDIVSPVVLTFLAAEVPAKIDKLAEISALRAKTVFCSTSSEARHPLQNAPYPSGKLF
jgi:hypothetical protein